MSILLYRLGGAISRRRGLVVGVWLLLLVLLGTGASTLGDRYDDSFSIPGTDSEKGQDLLAQRFGQTGANGQILFTAKKGKITDSANASEVGKLVKATDAIKGVSVRNPLTADQPMLNKGSTAALAQVNFSASVPSEHTLDAVQKAGTPPASSGVETSVGGDAYKSTADPSKVPELLGLLVSFFILVLTFGSLLAAGMPILTSLIGVGVTLTSVILISRVVTVSSTAPTLAEMLGLAVGIDYALFIISRHRAQLAEGVEPVESMSRALATAGSAVVFAGTTVIIALAGLSVAGIPVLTVMGLGAAAAVTVAVSVALTLVPAIALLLGERLRPRVRRRRLRKQDKPRKQRRGFATTWVRIITRWPAVTALAVVILLGSAALPAKQLELALPDNSTAPASTPQRVTYDKITAEFGEGYNAPLAVTADVITSSDPKGTVSKLADAIKDIPGVVAVPQETPDEGGDTGLVQVIPKAGQTAPSTAALVQELRDRAPALEKKYKVSEMLVTGSTAVNIDASDRLGGALLPFGCIVIGLSLILLMIVFRSIAVPIKATLGYLLSVGAALGAVVAVFGLGWADALVPGLSDGGPIVSFLPIFVMGVLFGLAMDYEMFLVSAMREHYVNSGDAKGSVREGFKASSRVVTAAALIMTSVFVAFIPAGTSTIKQIAFGLAVGVFVDAFFVRMTLVPAVLMLLGHRAWWLPAWLEARLPVVDVEGAALHRKIAFSDWEAAQGRTTLLARGLVVRETTASIDLVARPGEITRVTASQGVHPRELGRVLAGRGRARAGELVVDGLLLPEQREIVFRRTALLEIEPFETSPVSTGSLFHERARLMSVSGSQRRRFADAASRQFAELEAMIGTQDARVDAILVETAMALAGGADVYVLTGLEHLSDGPRLECEALANHLADQGQTVIVVALESAQPSPASTDGAPRVLEGSRRDSHV
ncbi:MMPL family transporter [Aeromicrobium sp.]|uniref:MMPL family transporter n=1 Tax=Aeromicrobium sp. TaxID=1871063 RepID=UPI003D6A660C